MTASATKTTTTTTPPTQEDKDDDHEFEGVHGASPDQNSAKNAVATRGLIPQLLQIARETDLTRLEGANISGEMRVSILNK